MPIAVKVESEAKTRVERQPEKASAEMLCRLLEKTRRSARHSENANGEIVVIPPGKERTPSNPAKAYCSAVVKAARERSIVARTPEKARFPIEVTPSGKEIEARELRPLKASSPTVKDSVTVI